MKTKYFILSTLLCVCIACSVKKDKFINRNLHALSTEYNILYNGNVAIEKGLEELKSTYQDNFWEVLSVERMPEKDENFLPGQSKNSNFERAEEKAVKAIQKHSMNIEGTERNPQIDEAYLLLGKARYFDNRFIPSLEAFNYILYKYPKSDKIYHAKIWREKVNIRIDNNEIAIKNLKLLLKNNNLKEQDLADANAMIAQAYINLEVIDTALQAIKIAVNKTKNNEEKARYAFIKGQLYEKLNYLDSAYVSFQEVIDLNRKSPRNYVIQAHAKQAMQFNPKTGDSVVFLEKFNSLLEDRENRPYLDVLHHQMGIFYEKYELDSLALKHYNLSNRRLTKDMYLSASNFRNIGEIYFDQKEFKIAAKYFDSTLLKLNQNTKEFRKYKRRRVNLEDVIKYEDIVTINDSILNLVSFSNTEREKYFSNYIEKLKKIDQIKEEKQKKEAEKQANIIANQNKPSTPKFNPNPSALNIATIGPPVDVDGKSNFYFYNPLTVDFGIKEFQRKWGSRKRVENWRQSAIINENQTLIDSDSIADTIVSINDSIPLKPEYTISFYTSKIPSDNKIIDSLKIDRNEAYYQLGLIYKEKFKELPLAASRFEKLLSFEPEEQLKIPSKYHLYKIYEEINPEKAALLKIAILSEYPETRYAQIIANPNEALSNDQNPETVYKNIYKNLQEGEVRFVYSELNEKIDQLVGEEILPKFELLRAKVLARIEGIDAYKNALNQIVVVYPNSEEGKEAQELLNNDIPVLESLTFNNEDKLSWKLIFSKKYEPGKNYDELVKKLEKYIKDSFNDDLKVSTDVYDLENDFVVLHGFKSKETALAILNYLKENKTYKIKDEAKAISANNYSIVQIKKNYKEWLNIK